MAFNLANERIQDTYEQLVQISGSTLLNGIGTAIPAITNINSVSSSYAITASYAQYAVSASHEIVHELSSSYAETASFANFATTAGTATSATTAISASFSVTAGTATSATTTTSASHALFANQAGTATSATSATTATSASHALFANQAGTATTATTASYISPTFISASAAASGFGGGGGATPTLQQVTAVGNVTNLPITASGIDCAGNLTLSLASSKLRVLGIGAYIEATNITGSWGQTNGTHALMINGNISASSGFIGNGSGLTNINTAFGAELYFNAADYVIDLPGDFNDPAVTVSISQSGVYLISSSKVPPYGTNGPRVNLQWCPQQLGSGVAKVKFFIPSLDTGNGVSYKQSVSCSADYQYIWNSTTTPSGSTALTIARSLTLPQYSNGSGVTNMIKGQDGFVYFSTAGTPVPSQGYIYTGPSIGLLV